MKYVILLIIILIIVFIFYFIKIKINKYIIKFKNQRSFIKDIENMMVEPAIKSVSGATDIYLKKILNDFPEFHNPEAEIAIKNSIREFILLQHYQKQQFEISNIDIKNINIPYLKNSAVSNIIFNKISINSYEKTLDYATICYQISVGYDCIQHFETRFNVLYTLKLGNNLSNKAFKCPNCGATLNSTGDRKCKYCNADIIIDTILNWVITDITEIK